MIDAFCVANAYLFQEILPQARLRVQPLPNVSRVRSE
jgi:hypothetical protein